MHWHFQLISAAAWRVLHRFFAFSPQTAQTVMKSLLKRTHICMRCMRQIYLSIQSASSIYPSSLPHLYNFIYRSSLAEPHSCRHSSERTCPLREAESLSKYCLNYVRMRPFLPSCVFFYLSLTPHWHQSTEPLRSNSARYPAILRCVAR